MTLPILNGLDLSSQRIVNLADPSSATDAVTKQYVDNFVNGLAWKDEVRVATTANGTLASAYENGDSVDGVTLATGDRILVKNQTTQTENGIYTVNASGAPTRAVDADSGAELKQATVRVTEGTTNGNTQWTCSNTGTITIGSTNITFATSGGGTTYSAGNGLQLSSSTFSVLGNGTSINVSSSGVKLDTSAGGNGVTVDSSGVIAVGAGTGITVGSDTVAVDTSVVARKASANIGNGSSTSIAFTHNLGTKDVVVQVRRNSDDAGVITDWVATDTNTVTLTFASAPASAAYRVTAIG